MPVAVQVATLADVIPVEAEAAPEIAASVRTILTTSAVNIQLSGAGNTVWMSDEKSGSLVRTKTELVVRKADAVSYTHLTLPTKRIV